MLVGVGERRPRPRRYTGWGLRWGRMASAAAFVGPHRGKRKTRTKCWKGGKIFLRAEKEFGEIW